MFNFLELFLVPLSFLPTSIMIFFRMVVYAFALYIVGRLFKWLWDALPVA